MKERLQVFREMVGFIRRRHIPVILIFVGLDALSIYMALTGDALFAVFALAIMLLFVVFFWAMSAGLIDSILAEARESLEYWGRDNAFAKAVMVDHVAVMAELAEHDPVSAEQHRDRFATRLLAHNPSLEAELATLREKADWN